VRGSCACGAVRFALAPPLRAAVACHCVSCRKQTGHFVVATRAAKASLTFQAGEGEIRWWRATPEAERGFCEVCGALLFWQREGSDHISVMMGVLDAPIGIAMDRHIFCAEKGDYYEIDDGLAQFSHAD